MRSRSLKEQDADQQKYVKRPGWSNAVSPKEFFNVRDTIGPLLLMIITPTFTNIVSVIIKHYEGSLSQAFDSFVSDGPIHFFKSLPSSFDPIAWKIIVIFISTVTLLTWILPGKVYLGPITAHGNCPAYKDNGVLFFVSFLALFLLGSQLGIGLYNGGIFCRFSAELLAALNIFGIAFCVGLYLKGLISPSTEDYFISGNPIKDFYVGIEHHARVLGFDVKQITNSRFGMAWWPIANVSTLFYQLEEFGKIDNILAAAVAVHVVYMLKFFFWEKGYFHSMDMQYDRCGYYLCWGCLVWVPSLYNLPNRYAASHPLFLSNGVVAWTIFVVGVTAVAINYDIDRQRTSFRLSDGKEKVWGAKPTFIEVSYVTENGEKKKNKLLSSGYWGISRHLHYFPEWIAALCWTPPVYNAVLPYSYFVFIVILLVDRERRDEARCLRKYGKGFEQYCKQVRWRIIPGIY